MAAANNAQSIISFNIPETSSIIACFAAMLCLCMSAFVSGSELAFFSLKETDFDKFEDPDIADKVRLILSNPEKLLATILISNNLVNVTIIILLNFALNQILEVRSAVLDFIIQSVFLTFLILLFGEIIPKIYSSNNNIKFTRFAVPGISFLSRLFNPLSQLMVKSTFIVNKVVTKRADNISVDELSQALELSEVNSENEKELLEGILTFGDKTVAEIMRPRVDVVDIEYNENFDEVVKIVVENGYSRMPVYEENYDNIKGVLYAKDLLPYIGKRSKDFNWTSLVRPAYFVPETLSTPVFGSTSPVGLPNFSHKIPIYRSYFAGFGVRDCGFPIPTEPSSVSQKYALSFTRYCLDSKLSICPIIFLQISLSLATSLGDETNILISLIPSTIAVFLHRNFMFYFLRFFLLSIPKKII